MEYRLILYPWTPYRIDLKKFPPKNIRNFGIIAHVDHGKSTLSDRFLEITASDFHLCRHWVLMVRRRSLSSSSVVDSLASGRPRAPVDLPEDITSDVDVAGTVSADKAREQFLDKLPVERERGITVKAQTSSMLYKHNGETFLLNLIDTPGHVDFSYEVLRSLSACGGALLLVDANQGIQAQTIANYNLAFLAELPLIPVLNKIDLSNAKPEMVSAQVQRVLGVREDEILKVSAKVGTGIDELLKAIVERIPSPKGSPDNPFRAHLFDSWHDKTKGIICLINVVDGSVQLGDVIVSHLTGKEYQVLDLGVMYPDETSVPKLHTGQVGYVVGNMHTIADAKLGDTFYHKSRPAEPLPLIEQSKPMVYAGIYPVSLSQLKSLEKSIDRLVLNDPSVHMTMDSSPALGQGWRLGFLGLLHMEVFCQRLEMEFGELVVITAPSVPYKVGRMWVMQERRGVGLNTTFIDQEHSMFNYKFPLSEIIIDFCDKLMACTSGYARFSSNTSPSCSHC
ncbi:GUF1 [Cordylochernes scorpioides]|uniref:GUF1 n=1 Tax=Cordylochernes scorpioides TaxID=51811 RepID=A0ABY6LEL9_9ARAC|nr:GUF1 [Cordylochernes scorpioides]